jgi:hypothetical protein
MGPEVGCAFFILHMSADEVLPAVVIHTIPAAGHQTALSTAIMWLERCRCKHTRICQHAPVLMLHAARHGRGSWQTLASTVIIVTEPVLWHGAIDGMGSTEEGSAWRAAVVQPGGATCKSDHLLLCRQLPVYLLNRSTISIEDC